VTVENTAKNYVDPGSFRDPSGRLFHSNDRTFRLVSEQGWNEFSAVWKSGIIDDLAAEEIILPLAEVDATAVRNSWASAKVFETKTLPFVSWPYEWPFSALKAAALLHLDLHLKLLARGFTLSDASAYNVQFRGARPVFVDHLSLRTYVDGELWVGHRQFCEQFLNPLLLAHSAGVMPNSWYRGTQEGLPTRDVVRLIPWRRKFSWPMFMHVVVQARLDRAALAGARDLDTKAMNRARFPKASVVNMLRGLRRWIEGMTAQQTNAAWLGYAEDNSYSQDEAAQKAQLVAEMSAELKPSLVLDLGCNTGDYAAMALAAGAKLVVGFDGDFGALEAAFARSRKDNLNFLPLYFDAANPAPNQGWAQEERAGFADRSKGDALLALAFIHHLAIGRNVPLERVVDWLIDRAPHGIIEFVPKEDPMVQRLLALRDDIFSDYSTDVFLAAIRGRANIVSDIQLSQGGRRLVRYARRPEGP